MRHDPSQLGQPIVVRLMPWVLVMWNSVILSELDLLLSLCEAAYTLLRLLSTSFLLVLWLSGVCPASFPRVVSPRFSSLKGILHSQDWNFQLLFLVVFPSLSWISSPLIFLLPLLLSLLELLSRVLPLRLSLLPLLHLHFPV